ncbi:hypothetical protein N0V93_001700 [Gnomoniopsis smithogilvyi]|uniref:O-fucosyltransferase family protein n=1 Tax=Gnomoniopsis smithogilvyi TaxID=1191159 RepID=A0A9W8Z426_9PEZI|nr:hypothetical protein N0V93_001700 [Gnomoniopsis smithogilvyi]
MLRNARHIVICALALLTLSGFYLTSYSNFSLQGSTSAPDVLFEKSRTKSPLSPHVHTYFDQVFGVETPPLYSFQAIKAACARAEWKEENKDVYLRCGGMSAGMTSIMSQVKVCLKMGIDAGVHIVLPAMPLRDSNDLLNFNLFNDSAYMPYENWFDSEHLTSSMSRACPQMKIKHSKGLGTANMLVAHEWTMDVNSAPGFQWLAGYFWVGRPFKVWFDAELSRLRSSSSDKSDVETRAEGDERAASNSILQQGATIISIASQFLIYRITDDATGRDLALWNDISHLVRFKEPTRVVIAKVLSQIERPFIGIHFRTERDNIWSSFDTQLKRDLDTLDTLLLQSGTDPEEKPLLYLACGDQSQIERFRESASQRGWAVTSKYDIVQDDTDTLSQLAAMPFDFQGAVDMGIMLKSHFFLGITGSAFSSTIANMRDSTGRYRGSSIVFQDDGNARTHLFNDGDASGYACCL